jgi:uncharacterized protein
VLTKKKLEYNAKNLNDFDAVLFYTGGELEMNDEQKAALLSFIRDDGKGFVGVHSATITFASWREYGEMLGGYFDEHPWGTFDAPILVEDPNFSGMQQWPKSFVLTDEIYQMKDFSRDKVRVLMRLDATKLDLHNPRVHRKDLDFAVTWAKMYGKGRVYYSTLGHVEQNWDDPRIQKMYFEAIKWAMGLVDADVTSRPAAAQANNARTDCRTEEAAQFTATSMRKGVVKQPTTYVDRKRRASSAVEYSGPDPGRQFRRQHHRWDICFPQTAGWRPKVVMSRQPGVGGADRVSPAKGYRKL